MHPLARISLVATATLMLLTSTASAQIGGSDVLGDGPTVVGPGVVSPPGVSVFASCTVARRAGTTVWFGYSNTLTERRVALVGSGNTVAANGAAGAANRGQTTQFQPGVVERAFAVTVPAGSTATWAVTPANILGVSDVPSSATSGASTPPCPTGVGVRSATPQIVGSLVPTISAAPLNQRVTNGLLDRASIGFSTTGVVSACSDGGVPLAPRVLWGYDVSPPGQASGLIVPAGAPYEALPVDKVVRVDSDGTFTFERSTQATRRVVDPQRVSVFGSLQEQLAGTAQVAWGYSSISVIADVEARCQFPNGVVKSSTTVWVDPVSGSGFNFHTVTDRAAQSTRPAAFCLSPYPTSGCDVRAIGVGPGGGKYR